MRTKSSSRFLIPILTFGVFGIINTEMGVVSIIPLIAERYGVTVAEAGWTVSVFAVIVALSAPVLPVFFSKYGRRFLWSWRAERHWQAMRRRMLR